MQQKSAGMKSPIGFLYLVLLLALCCLLIPREGESAAGIMALSNVGNESPDETLEGPEREQGLVGDPTGNGRKYAKELLQRGKGEKKSNSTNRITEIY